MPIHMAVQLGKILNDNSPFVVLLGALSVKYASHLSIRFCAVENPFAIGFWVLKGSNRSEIVEL